MIRAYKHYCSTVLDSQTWQFLWLFCMTPEMPEIDVKRVRDNVVPTVIDAMQPLPQKK